MGIIDKIARKGVKAAADTVGERLAAKAAKETEETSVRDAVQRSVEAPKEVGVDKRFKSGDKKGVYRGTEAFGGITPQKATPMRKQYMDKMEKGVPGANWYDESSADINRWTGGNVDDSNKMANALAITSSRTPVASNLMYANKGWNQALVGDEIHTGGFPTTMGKHITEAFNDPAASASGLKRSPFSAGLSVDWMGPEFANRPTHDIHDVRAWGIKDPITGKDWSKGIGDAGHRWLDDQAQMVTDEANKRGLGGKTDWTPYRSQAAAWIAQKAEKEGIPIGDAAKHYGSYAPDYQANITREWSTWPQSEHIPESAGVSNALRQQFADDMEQHVRGPQGIDQLARDMGALSDTVIPNAGSYEGMVNPGFVSRINVGKAPGSQRMDDASTQVTRSVAAAHGLLGAQKQVAYGYAGGNAPLKSAGYAQFLTPDGQPLSPEKVIGLSDRIAAAGGDIPSADATGARAILFPEEASVAQSRAKALRQVGADEGLDVQFKHRDSDIFPRDENFNAPDKWSTRPYIDEIMAGGDNVINGFDNFAKRKAGDMLGTVEKYANEYGWSNAPWYPVMMKALQEGGIRALDKLQLEGKVPAVVGGSISALLGGEMLPPELQPQ